VGPSRSFAVPLAVVAALSFAREPAARAQAGTASANRYSKYERDAIEAALRDAHTSIDPSPEGKTLDGIDVVTLDVFEPRDPLPYPDFFDLFHTKTRRYVVEREILLTPGEPYRQSLVDDSVRNLTTLPALNFVVPQLSVVLAVPVRGSAPDHVRLLVITKDVWSLRPNWDLQASNGGVLLLSAQPAETNVAGTHTIANLNFVMNPAQIVVGAGYTNFRVDGSHVVLQPNANVVWSRSTGATEGSLGGLVAGQPLFSPRSRWAWDASVTWTDYIYRRFDPHLDVAGYTDSVTKGTIPNAFRGQLYGTEYTVTRSFGDATKQDATLGLSLAKNQYTVDAPACTVAVAHGTVPCSAEVAARTVQGFETAFVPASNTRVGPFVQYHTYEKRYVRLLDFETLGLQEDWRLGREAFVNLYPVAEALGSSSNFMGIDASLLYTVRLGDGLARGAVESITETDATSLPNASIDASVHVVSPTLFVGRFVYDAHVLYRYRNDLNQISYLGGDNRLRGYPSEQFFGKDVVSSNLEFRTHSIDILTAQVGLVGFYDTGDAFNGFSQLRPYDSVGLGVRGLFPQLDRSALRFDVGFPLGDGARLAGVTPVAFFVSLGQAFPVPVIGPGGGPGSPQLTGSPTTVLPPPP
jgi:hypothetical protein